jgi:hypothetical protein
MQTKTRCDSCEIVYIQGVRCHETGCPQAYTDETRECANCGTDFSPEHNHQSTCDHTCWVMYSGLDCYCDECSDETFSCECGECKHCTGEPATLEVIDRLNAVNSHSFM